MSSHVIALVGAESTGKTTLARELARVLAGRGVDAVMVPEALRDFCLQHDRTPLPTRNMPPHPEVASSSAAMPSRRWRWDMGEAFSCDE